MSSEYFDVPDFTTQQDIAKQRRQQAQRLIENALQSGGEMRGRIYVRKNPLENFMQGLAGGVLGGTTDRDATALARRRQEAQSRWQADFDAATDPAAKRRLLQTADAEGLRADLAMKFMTADEQRAAVAAQHAADAAARAEQAKLEREARSEQHRLDREARAEQKEADRTFREQQDKTYRRTADQMTAAVRQPRDRFQIVTDSDGQQYRVNIDTGEKLPLGLTKPPTASASSDKLTEAQGNAYLFGTRMAEAHKTLGEIGTAYNPMKTALARAAENTPGVNVGANAMLSGNEQRVLQAQRDFINAVLRKESGAAIGKEEFANAQKQYFPQVEDSPEVIKQKDRNREIAIQGMAKIAGPSAGKDIKADAGQPRIKAPQAALDYLKANPDQAAAFKAKYGYLP